MIRLVYNNKAFKILNEYQISQSNNEVTFNDITIDFTGYTLADMPYKYQEIKIMELQNENNLENGKTLFTGYLDDINISKMQLRKENREMTLTLLSPLKMATVRCVNLIGTFELSTAIRRILEPLLNDGFTIKEFNINDSKITANFILETVEYCMNNIGYKGNIFWYINEQKEIFVNSIDYMFNLPIKKQINPDIKEQGHLKIQPKIENIDYANIINFKNVRLIYSSFAQSPESANYPIYFYNKSIKKGDTINFNNPVIIGEKYLRNLLEENGNQYQVVSNFYLHAILSDGQEKTYQICINTQGNYVTAGNISYSDEETEKEIVLQRDSFFKNLITGLKWNVDSDATIIDIDSDTALRNTTMRFMYSQEINKLKDIVSKSGQIEKTVDFNEKWTSLYELNMYARSLMSQNSNTVNQVELEYDVNQDLNIGDIVEINEPDFYIQGKFAVKDIQYTYKNELVQNWKITLKSSDLLSSYIDIFRPKEQQEDEEKIETVILSEFIEENIEEKHSFELENNDHTLNFNLEV